MTDTKTSVIYVALLRGINVGGHKKVPMAKLKTVLEKTGFSQVKTLLNSGNVIFEGKDMPLVQMEEMIADRLQQTFGFPIPVLLRLAEDIQELILSDPFKGVALTKDKRLYVSFFKKDPEKTPMIPWVSDDGSFQILQIKNKCAISVLDISQTKTTDSMVILEKFFGKDITTRNWNTIIKIGKKL